MPFDTAQDKPLSGRRKVAIVGFCQTSRDMAPYEDPAFEVWGLNRGYIFMPRADRWFEMHGKNIYESQERRPGRHVDWLNQFPGPVYMHQRFEEIKNCVAYPLKAVADELGPWVWRIGEWDEQGRLTKPSAFRDTGDEPYLSSSIAYEIALAIQERFEEIHLYGIDLNTEAEYAWQKPGVEFLLGVAAGRGIKVVLPDNCPLLKAALYGRGFLSPEGEHMSYEQLTNRLKALRGEQNSLQQEIAALNGARRELTFLQDQLVPGLDHERLEERRKRMDATIGAKQKALLEVVGGVKETAYWLHQTMAGQEPREAMEQLRELEQQELRAEGPLTDLEVMQFSENGITQDSAALETAAQIA